MGGQIREVISTGNGAKVMGGAAGFVVGNLNIPGLHQPWEGEESYPSAHVEGVSRVELYSKPLTVLLDASAQHAGRTGAHQVQGRRIVGEAGGVMEIDTWQENHRLSMVLYAAKK